MVVSLSYYHQFLLPFFLSHLNFKLGFFYKLIFLKWKISFFELKNYASGFWLSAHKHEDEKENLVYMTND